MTAYQLGVKLAGLVGTMPAKDYNTLRGGYAAHTKATSSKEFANQRRELGSGVVRGSGQMFNEGGSASGSNLLKRPSSYVPGMVDTSGGANVRPVNATNSNIRRMMSQYHGRAGGGVYGQPSQGGYRNVAAKAPAVGGTQVANAGSPAAAKPSGKVSPVMGAIKGLTGALMPGVGALMGSGVASNTRAKPTGVGGPASDSRTNEKGVLPITGGAYSGRYAVTNSKGVLPNVGSPYDKALAQNAAIRTPAFAAGMAAKAQGSPMMAANSQIKQTGKNQYQVPEGWQPPTPGSMGRGQYAAVTGRSPTGGKTIITGGGYKPIMGPAAPGMTPREAENIYSGIASLTNEPGAPSAGGTRYTTLYGGAGPMTSRPVTDTTADQLFAINRENAQQGRPQIQAGTPEADYALLQQPDRAQQDQQYRAQLAQLQQQNQQRMYAADNRNTSLASRKNWEYAQNKRKPSGVPQAVA